MSRESSFLLPPTLATPTTRRGPSSRLLQRRSLLLKDQIPDQDRLTINNDEEVTTNFGGRTENNLTLFRASPIVRRSMMNMTAKLGETIGEITRPLFAYHVASSMTGKSDGDALILATENLFVDFMASGNANENVELLDQVAEFEEMVDDHVATIQTALEKNLKINKEGYKATLEIKENLTNERNTWRLIGKLFAIRASFENPQPEDSEMKDSQVLTESSVVENLFEKDELLRKAQAVVDWLELNVKDNMRGHEVEDAAYGDAILGWENTLHALISDKNRNKRLVTQLDPDSKYRMNKPLHDDDENDEQRLIKLLFFYIRAGMLERAQTLCVQMGQPWRAATLTGWRLCHDPNLGGSAIEDKMPMEGNLRRDIWKKTAWKLSNDSKLPNSERAIYSAFCGNSKQLLSKCSSWEDMVWSLVRCMVDVLVEKEIRSSINKNYVELPQEYWDNKTDLDSILQAVNNSENGKVQEGARSPYRVLQSHIILGEWDKLMQAAGEFADTNDPHLLRFMCHLALTVEKFNGNLGVHENIKQTLLENLIKFLIASARVQQVAWYVSRMTDECQIGTYASFLNTVVNTDDRLMCLRLGFEHQLPMKQIRYELVDNILSFSSMSAEGNNEDDESFNEDLDDRKKISGLDWLFFDPIEEDYAIIKSNELARYFIAEHKIEKAKEVLRNARRIFPEEDYPDEHVKENQCLEMFVRAKESFSDFFEFYHKGQPRKPEILEGKPEYTAQVAYEQKCKQYANDMERWQKSLLIQSHEVSARLEAILTYPGGWLLCEIDEEAEQNQSRIKELSYLRRICIVECVFLLQCVLHDTKQFKESIKIADLLADERNGLYALFSKEEMRKLLGKLKESSVAMIESDNQSDVWGYCQK